MTRTRGIPAVAAALLGAGCGHGVYTLEPRWAPLEGVVERPVLGLGDDGATTTIGSRCYVVDLDAWLRDFPPGSVEQEALLLHEREHAVRQRDAGVGAWLGRYLKDRAFMWREEQRGWALQLRRLREAGRSIDPVLVALALTSYRNFAGRMVGFPEGLAFVQSVLAGTWTPPEEVGHD